VTDRLGVSHHFEAVFDIAAADYVPKPAPGPYRELLARHGLDPKATAFVEDIARNLLPAHELGMTTLWVRHDTHWASDGAGGAHVHHETDDLVAWLEALLAAREAGGGQPAS
jgi:putative hydrolase of the HAD superfamily